ncbi:MAG: hypothetical protein R2800_02890 [Flavipsychrobacter sp.]
MKYRLNILAIVIIAVLTSCDPVFTTYIRNNSSHDAKVLVRHFYSEKKTFSWDTDSLPLHTYNLKGVIDTIVRKRLTDSTYTAIVPAGKALQLYPKALGSAIKDISVAINDSTTCCGSRPLLRYYKSKCLIKHHLIRPHIYYYIRD